MKIPAGSPLSIRMAVSFSSAPTLISSAVRELNISGRGITMVANPKGKFVTAGYSRVLKQGGGGPAESSIVGSVVVDQVYAQNQHESVWFKHPRGGQAMYLHDPLFANSGSYMQR